MWEAELHGMLKEVWKDLKRHTGICLTICSEESMDQFQIDFAHLLSTLTLDN